VDKRSLSERDICSKFISPALRDAGWDDFSQIREEVAFTRGRIIVRGKLVTRGQAKRADYILYYRPNIPLAVIEAKDNTHSVGAGMQQALEYAEALGVPFIFSSNGDGFVFHDRIGTSGARETELALDAFPSPASLWARYRASKGISDEAEQIVLQDYFDDGSGKTPRYYQVSAVNAAIEAIAQGRDRVLLVMATGTGKTYTAFQIIWRLWKAGRKKRILYLADRNVLIDQTMVNDFRPFGPVMAKLSTNARTIERPDGTTVDLTLALGRKRRIDTAYEIYLGLYQAITGPEDRQKPYREFSPGFFDLVVIDECHRGSAAEDSAWREILEYFSAATQIGMTATPKETRYVSNIEYFGTPIYSYSLKQGIRDGFLAPYKVVKVHIDRDVQGYRPEKGQLDREGEEVEDRIYNTKDFDRTLVLDERTRLVAKKITEFLKAGGDRMQKTIVFCVDQEHAARMRRALINENGDLVAEHHRYVMRITGGNPEGQEQLSNFIDPESAYPVLVTTSRLLSTGVDVQTCRLIALDREVGSMTEFKQIVGRGTRVHEDTRKFYFTLLDFRGATNHFADPDFDGEPVQIYEPHEDDPITPPDDAPPIGDDGEALPDKPGPDEVVVDGPPDIAQPTIGTGVRKKVYVDGVPATIVAERVEYLDENGKLVTESLRDYTKKALRRQFASLDEFLRRWKAAERKQAVLDEIETAGLPLDPILEELGRDLDPELLRQDYRSPIPQRFQWHTWAADPEGITGEELLNFANAELFPGLKNLSLSGQAGGRPRVVRDVFEDAYNYMKSGQLMRQVINRINGIDFNNLADRQHFGDIYEQILNDLQSAGNAGEYYTPRAVTAFMADRIDPRPGEILLDPACGTGGFLTCAMRHMRERYVKRPEDERKMQTGLRAVEEKQLPHMLCVTNMLLHEIEDPSFVRHDNTLARPYVSYTQSDRVDIVLTNPPFGGREEDGIENNFPNQFRTRETADLFLALIIRLLKPGGRAAVVLPDGTLFGEGVKTRLKEHLMQECNLHTIVRLPNSVFRPYASIGTNLLFFEKGGPTKDIWFWEHRVPEGQKAYSMTRPIRFEHLQGCIDWWGGAKRQGREAGERAWKVTAEEVSARGYNLDIKNPHAAADTLGDPEQLLTQLDAAAAEAAALRDQLKAALAEALLR
jgi:type I restriction enzyme R subunit